MTTFAAVDPDTDVDLLCPRGVCAKCDAVWRTITAAYAVVTIDGKTTGQVGLDNFAGGTA